MNADFLAKRKSGQVNEAFKIVRKIVSFQPSDKDVYLYTEDTRLLDEKPVFLARRLIESAGHAAIPAFDFDELREVALPIPEAYLKQEKNNYPESDPRLIKLSRDIHKYLEGKK